MSQTTTQTPAKPQVESKPIERPKPQFPANTVFRDDKVVSPPAPTVKK